MENDTCMFCENTGITCQADGADDFTPEYCSCDAGVALQCKQESNVMAFV